MAISISFFFWQLYRTIRNYEFFSSNAHVEIVTGVRTGVTNNCPFSSTFQRVHQFKKVPPRLHLITVRYIYSVHVQFVWLFEQKQMN